MKIYYAVSKLEGLAGVLSVNYSWADWKQKLHRAFSSQIDYRERYEQLEEKMWRRKEGD